MQFFHYMDCKVEYFVKGSYLDNERLFLSTSSLHVLGDPQEALARNVIWGDCCEAQQSVLLE